MLHLLLALFLGCLLLCPYQTSLAADWSQGQWQILHTETTDSLVGIRGLDCSDGITHLVLTVQEPSGGYRFHHHRWSPDGYLGTVEWPYDLYRWFRDMNYDSVDLQQPAFLSTTTFWRMTPQGWDSLFLGDETGSLRPQCFSFDSSGAMHYVLHSFTTSYLYYLRTGGEDSARCDTIECNFELGCSSGNGTRICTPTAQDVVLVIGWDDAVGWVPNFWNLVFLHAEGDEPFSSGSEVQPCGRSNPQMVLSARGEWIYAIYTSALFQPKVWVGANGLPYMQDVPFGTQIGLYRIYDNSFDSTFEIAAAVWDETPVTLRISKLNREWGVWEDDATLALPTDHQAFHIVVDSLGRGHLFTVDSTHLWYFGPNVTGDIRDPLVAHPLSFSLSSYPNPINHLTTLSFSLPQTQDVRLAVFDITGREVAVVTEGRHGAGEHRVAFDGTELSSGIYFAHLTAGTQQMTQKLLLVK